MEAVSNAWHSLAIKPEKMRNHRGEELGKTGGNWTRKPEAKKSKAGGRKKTENRRNWSKIQRKNPENRGRQSTNFIYHRLRLSLSKHIETENRRETRRKEEEQKEKKGTEPEGNYTEGSKYFAPVSSQRNRGVRASRS
jgi:hypothetical protein